MTHTLQFLACVAALGAAAAALHGWGGALQSSARLPRMPAPVTVALGLAVVLAIGGPLNLLQLAYAPVLWAVAAGGLVLFARQVRGWRPARPDGERALAGGLIAFVVGLAIATQLPPQFFNHHDDLEKYFAHPVRMLATGTVSGSPLSALGSETLGGMAFLHGFVASVLPIGYVNGVDAVFGFGLVLALGAAAGRRRLAPLPAAGLVALLVACIDPLYVNVSALYLGAALMTAAIMVSADAPEGPPPLALGVLYAALVALKPTLALFGALHGLFTAVAVGVTRRPADGVAWALRTMLWSALALLPWVALHAAHYLGGGGAGAAVPDHLPEPGDPSALERVLFVSARYWFLGALGVAAVALCVVAVRRGAAPRWPAASLLASALATTLAPMLLLGVFGRLLSDDATNLRYVIPWLLALPAVFVLAIALPLPRARLVRPAGALAMLAAALGFAPAASARYAMALRDHNILSYLSPAVAQSPEYRGYFRHVLSEDAAVEVRALQHLVPEKAPVVVWLTVPFYLDYARNPIYDVEPAGVSTYWAQVPADARYVIWEHAGPAVRHPDGYAPNSTGRRERVQAVRALDFVRWLEREKQAGEVLYEDGRFAVFRLRPARVD